MRLVVLSGIRTKPSDGWQTIRGGGSVDHLSLVGRHVGSSSFLLLLHPYFLFSFFLPLSLAILSPPCPCTNRLFSAVKNCEAPREILLQDQQKRLRDFFETRSEKFNCLQDIEDTNLLGKN